jgi:hypothetical protein
VFCSKKVEVEKRIGAGFLKVVTAGGSSANCTSVPGVLIKVKEIFEENKPRHPIDDPLATFFSSLLLLSDCCRRAGRH